MESSTQTDGASKRPRCMGARVDYLQIAFQVELGEDVKRELQHRAAAARDHGGNIAEILVGKLVAQLRVLRDGVERWPFRNADVRGQIGLREPGGWSVEFHVAASYLATHSIEQSIRMCEEIASSLGRVHGRRLRRIDLCADFSGFELVPELAEALVLPRRGGLTDFRPELADQDDRDFLVPGRTTHRISGKVTGFTVCRGNDLSARIYDKTKELQLANREEKRAIEHARWRVSGWVEGEPITRVEYQLRGVALDELDLREPTAKRLAERLDPVWQYCSRIWLHMIDATEWRQKTSSFLRNFGPSRDTSGESGQSAPALESETKKAKKAPRRDRCGLDPRWTAVQDVTFKHAFAEPSVRRRKRGGATPEQAFGAMLSALSGLQALPRVRRLVGETEGQATRELTKDQQDAYLRSLMVDACMTAAFRFADHFQQTLGIAEAPEAIVTKWNATWARFWSADDTEMPGRWTARPSGDPTDARWLLSWAESTSGATLGELLGPK